MQQRLLPPSLNSAPATTGGLLIMTLVFVMMFLVIFTSLAGLVNRTYHESVLQAQDETAFQVAEAGLDYGRWRLAHAPEDYSAKTTTIEDQFAGDLGTYEVTFAPPATGGTSVLITSIGTTAAQPGRTVELQARYGRPSLARYASITNSDVWYGGTISGPVHSNGGIRMDGTSDSLMTSAQETYVCQAYHGCNNLTKPGVWGTGVIQDLWEFPVVAIDYNGLTSDLLAMKTAAVAAGTYYGPSGAHGYQIVFNSDNTYTISRVTARGPKIWSWWQGAWKYTSHDVGTMSFITTAPVPSNGIIFIEDTAWIRGDIRDRISVAAGVFPDTPNSNVDIIVNGNMSYGGVLDGTRSLGVIAQRNVQIPWSGAPNDMVLQGAFIAQKGSFHRRYYDGSAQTHRLKDSLTRYGMIASYGVPATAWVSGNSVVSGFRQGSSAYDPNMLYNPPPYFPTAGQYDFISWEEQQ